MDVDKSDAPVLPGVKRVILILSGKGGVGKSTVVAQLAYSLVLQGKKVGILDIDLCGPSMPKMLKVEDREVHQCDSGWLPVFTDASQRLGVMSIGFLLKNEDEAVVWRGPKKNAMIKQFLTDVAWNDRDVLLIDTPPGTSDEHITVMETIRSAVGLRVDGAILVTTPQAVAVNDVRRELTFCKKTGLNVLGIVENMSGYICPHCSECTDIFSKGGGQALADMAGLRFLGRIPIDPVVAQSGDNGESVMDKFKDSETAKVFQSICNQLLALEK